MATPHPHDPYPVEYIFCTSCKATAPSETKWNQQLQREDIQALVYWITRPWNKIDPGDPIRKILQRYG